MHCAKKITNGAYVDRVSIAFCLNYYFSAPKWVWIEHNCVHTSVSARLRYLDLAAVSGEFSLKNLSYEMLELFPAHCGNVCALLHTSQNVGAGDKPLIVPVEI